MQDYAAGCSLVQLLRLQELLKSEVRRQGWSMDHLEATLSVVQAHSSRPLQGTPQPTTAATAAATETPAGTGIAASDAAVAEMIAKEREAEDAALEGVQEGPHPEAAPAKGAQDAAAMRSQERHMDMSRGVPVLLVHVRGRLGMSVSFDLVSGALCLHAGESNLPGQSFCTVSCPTVQYRVFHSVSFQYGVPFNAGFSLFPRHYIQQ